MFFWYLMNIKLCNEFFFFSSRRRHTRCLSDWSSDVCSSDLAVAGGRLARRQRRRAAARVRVGEQPRAVGAQLQRARVQPIVERGQELVEGRREQAVGALDRLES